MLDNHVDNAVLVLGTLVGYLKRKERRDRGRVGQGDRDRDRYRQNNFPS